MFRRLLLRPGELRLRHRQQRHEPTSRQCQWQPFVCLPVHPNDIPERLKSSYFQNILAGTLSYIIDRYLCAK